MSSHLRILFLLLISVFLPVSVSALTITRGQSATINWTVSNATNCIGGFSGTPYPFSNGDGVFSAWNATTTNASGAYTFPTFRGDPSVAFPQTYIFTCTAGVTVGSDTVTINDCGSGTTWNGTSCVLTCNNNATNPPTCNQCPANSNYIWNSTTSSCEQNPNIGSCNATSANSTQGCVCLNGANNPPSCNQCPNGYVWNVSSSSCVPCSNGPCWGSGGNPSDPDGNLSCSNGATNPPACSTCPSSQVMNGSNQCVSCSNGGCSGGVCSNGANNPPSCSTCDASKDWRSSTSSCVPKPVIGTFVANPSSITGSGSTNLEWTGVTGATSCTITATPGSDPGSVSTFPNGSISSGNRGNDTVFRMTCTNGITDTYLEAQLVVGAGPTVVANIGPALIPQGGSLTTLNFTGSNLGGNGGCTGERSDTSATGPWYATYPVSKDDRIQSVNFTSSGTVGPFTADAWYRYICYNNAGVASAPAIVHANVDLASGVTLTPSGPQSIAPGNSIVFTSQANDSDSNLNEHNIDWTDNASKWNYEVGHIAAHVTDSNVVGDLGTVSPAASSNSNGITLRFNNPGTYSVRASASDNNNTAESPLVTVSVACPTGSAWNGSTCVYTPATFTVTSPGANTVDLAWDCNIGNGATTSISRSPGAISSNLAAFGNAQDTSSVTANTYYEYTLRCFIGGSEVSTAVRNVTTPDNLSVNIVTTCDNGAINPDETNSKIRCTNCGPGLVFNGYQCVSSITAFTNLSVPYCGNGIVERGEECDGGADQSGSAGLSSPNSQRCTALCTVACSDRSLTAPSCGGAVEGKVYTSNGSQVTACKNGALQSSAPNCNVCPQGEMLVGTVCRAPMCGDNTVAGSEECDRNSLVTGVIGGKFCTNGCTEVSVGATDCSLQNFEMSCTGATNYEITDGANNIRSAGAYSSPVTLTATGEDTYTFKCLRGASAVSTARSATCVEPNSYNSIILSASPKSIQKNANLTLSWTITNPNDSCKVVAQPVVTAPTPNCDAYCVADRAREAARLTSTLRYTKTDNADGARDMSVALSSGVSGKAAGRKTVSMKYSTIFIGSCTINALRDNNATKVRVQVVGDNEG